MDVDLEIRPEASSDRKMFCFLLKEANINFRLKQNEANCGLPLWEKDNFSLSEEFSFK